MEPGGDINRRNLARAFCKRACEDRDVARILLKEGKYADSALHSQQCGEKAIKSFLVIQNRFLTSHIVSGELSRIIEEQNIPDGEHLLEIVRHLERHWIKPRYPFLSTDGKIQDPLDIYTEKQASEALQNAEYVLERVKALLPEIL